LNQLHQLEFNTGAASTSSSSSSSSFSPSSSLSSFFSSSFLLIFPLLLPLLPLLPLHHLYLHLLFTLLQLFLFLIFTRNQIWKNNWKKNWRYFLWWISKILYCFNSCSTCWCISSFFHFFFQSIFNYYFICRCMIYETSSYLDVKQRMKAVPVVMSLLSDPKFIDCFFN
jgi:hypothetical protein